MSRVNLSFVHDNAGQSIYERRLWERNIAVHLLGFDVTLETSRVREEVDLERKANLSF